MSENLDPEDGPVIAKEKEVVYNMIHLYCEKKHKSEQGTLCHSCKDLLRYSHHRLSHCPYGEDKPTCRKCEKHCYRPEMRDHIKRVMRYSGPRLLLRAPIDWIRHQMHDRT